MRAVMFLAGLWLAPFLFFGWRIWMTWPSKQARERQHEVSKLYDHHFGRRRRLPYVWRSLVPISPGSSAHVLNRQQRTYSPPIA